MPVADPQSNLGMKAYIQAKPSCPFYNYNLNHSNKLFQHTFLSIYYCPFENSKFLYTIFFILVFLIRWFSFTECSKQPQAWEASRSPVC